MKREIKLRVWNIDDNKMEQPLVFAIGNDGILKPLITCSDGNKAYKDYPIMQFTGIKDKNGLEVYEGDISIINGELCVVTFCNYFTCGWEFKINGKNGFGVYTFGDIVKNLKGVNCTDFEIIGNIYQNPELLSVKPHEA